MSEPLSESGSDSGSDSGSEPASEAALHDVEESWPVRSSRDIHRDDWVVALRADEVQTPDGVPIGHERLVLEHPGAAVVLAVDDSDRAIVLGQYRHPAQRRFVELPAGICDGGPGEDPLDVARRELREEVQLQAETWTHLASVWASPGISAEVHHLYLARDLAAAPRGDFELRDEEAHMTSRWVPFEELYRTVVAGGLGDAPLLTAVLLARARGLV